MIHDPDPASSHPLVAVLSAERARLVRLCALFTGEPDVAEDLAQEALTEAWAHRNRLTDPAGADRWLAAIARNVCRRWRRRSGQEASRFPHLPLAPSAAETDRDHWPVDPIDVELELEREDLAALLDRALALLPRTTSSVLLQHYVDELPQAAIAAGLGLSEGAVAVRIHRGKLTLRRLLASPEFRPMAVAHGLAVPPDDGWTETRIWCPYCGRRRMIGRWATAHHDYGVRCPDCFCLPGRNHCADAAPLVAGLSGFKPAMSRVMVWADAYYRRALADDGASCPACGRFAPVRRTPPATQLTEPRDRRGVHVWCEDCSIAWDLRFVDLALWLPEGRRFWRDHPRIRLLPEREVEGQGRPALITTFESVTGTARFEVVSARDTFDVLGVYRTPAS